MVDALARHDTKAMRTVLAAHLKNKLDVVLGQMRQPAAKSPSRPKKKGAP
jgi:hypothetical protein